MTLTAPSSGHSSCGCPELDRVADLVLRLAVGTGMIRRWRCDWSI